MIKDDFIELCNNATYTAIQDMLLPLEQILVESDRLYETEKCSLETQDKDSLFDLYSYAVFKVLSKHLRSEKSRSELTRAIGENIYSHIKELYKLSANGPGSDEKIKQNLDTIIQFFVDSGYVTKGNIDWRFFNNETLQKGEKTNFVYIMENPVILPSAQRLYTEEGIAQHYSSRVIESALVEFGIEGREVKDFDPRKFDIEYVAELWELKINQDYLWINIGKHSLDKLVCNNEPETVLLKNIGSVHGKILDAACGEGRNMKYLCSRGFDVYGVDISLDMVKKAVALSHINNTAVHVADICNMPYADNSFDTILLFDILHHIKEPEKALQEIFRVINNNGKVMLNALSQDDFSSHVGIKISPYENMEGGLYSKFYDFDMLRSTLCRHFSIEHICDYQREDNPHISNVLSRNKKHRHDYLYAVARKK